MVKTDRTLHDRENEKSTCQLCPIQLDQSMPWRIVLPPPPKWNCSPPLFTETGASSCRLRSPVPTHLLRCDWGLHKTYVELNGRKTRHTQAQIFPLFWKRDLKFISIICTCLFFSTLEHFVHKQHLFAVLCVVERIGCTCNGWFRFFLPEGGAKRIVFVKIVFDGKSDAPFRRTQGTPSSQLMNVVALQRWFVLRGNLLFYYEKKDDKDPIGVVILEGCTVELSEMNDTNSFTFELVFAGKRDKLLNPQMKSDENISGGHYRSCAFEEMKLYMVFTDNSGQKCRPPRVHRISRVQTSLDFKFCDRCWSREVEICGFGSGSGGSG